MYSLHKLADLSSILDLKAHYLERLTAPMDGMWDTGFVNSSPHWEIQLVGSRVGYYALNAQGSLVQFYVLPALEKQGRAIFNYVVDQNSITKAIASTIDPTFLSYCLYRQKQVEVHTYLYEMHTQVHPVHTEAERIDFRLVDVSELERTIAFQQICLGAENDLSNWLRGYSGNLIDRSELYILYHHGERIGLGEFRKSTTQKGIVDLGMMVHPDHRRKGWATYILTLLSAESISQGLHPICSTTVDNTGSQKAIERAGFVNRNCIMNITF